VYVGRVLLTLIQMSSGARGAVVVVGGDEAGMVGVGVVVGGAGVVMDLVTVTTTKTWAVA
jgi:hypothetical protein